MGCSESNPFRGELSEFCRTGHPRPQFQRGPDSWRRLDGEWKFLFDDSCGFHHPTEISEWPLRIQVPFAPETIRSGIHDMGYHECCWYERDVDLGAEGDTILLHFGAVDYFAEVWVNGRSVGTHTGGHTSFSFDITPFLVTDRPQRISVRVHDDPLDLAKPRGKQDWRLEPHSIWYPRTTGIWQSVWIERVPHTRIESLRWTPYLETWEIGMEAFMRGHAKDCHLKVKLQLGDRVLANDTYQVVAGEVHRRIALSDPGIDDYRNEILWSPESPALIAAEVSLWREGECIDRIFSYTALRSFTRHHDRFMLNGRPYYLRLVLDQGYWPETFMTPPDEEALRKDIELTKQMGFNGVRKHQKIEDPRYLFWADVMGLLVWEEMPSSYRFTHESVERLLKEWMEVIDRDYSHPCIAVWVPFNESWGVPDLQDKAAHQHCVQALYHLTKTLDVTRLVVGNDGWESTATDLIGIHDYDNEPRQFQKRYGPAVTPRELLSRRGPAGRLLTVEGHPHAGQPIILSEFGGIALESAENGKTWGYSVARNPNELRQRYQRLLAAVHHVDLFSGFCYTQFSDTFQEANGLLRADRTPKFAVEEIAKATRGIDHDMREQLSAEAPV